MLDPALYEAHNEAYFGVYKLSSLVDELRFSAQRVQSGLDAPLDAVGNPTALNQNLFFLSVAVLFSELRGQEEGVPIIGANSSCQSKEAR